MDHPNTNSPNNPLPWEHLGANPSIQAFLLTALELVLHPVRFSRRMATEGGLHEPLMFFWVTMTIATLSSFPLALSYFGVAGPSPQSVSISTYNLHLLPSRLTGFLVLILPVLMFVGAVFLLVGGTIFYLAGQFFGIRRWEGAVTILSYAKSGSLIPLVVAELLLFLLVVACYVVTLIAPEYSDLATRLLTTSLPFTAVLMVLLSAAVFFTLLLAGTIQTFQLDAASGTAASLSGIVLVFVTGIAPPVSYRMWGITGVAVTTGVLLLFFVVLWLTGWLIRPSTPSGST